MVLLASDYDKSRFLKATDIPSEHKFRIKDVTPEEIGTGANKEKKLVVWFTNDDRGLVLNKTNNRILRGAFGDDTAGWKGKIIILFTMMKPMGGKMVSGLSVRIPPPKQAGTRTVTAGKEYNGNGSVAAKPPAATKPPAQDDELDEVVETQPPPKPEPAKPIADDLDDEINF